MISNLFRWVKDLLRIRRKPKYWFILYEDGSIDGGIIDFDNIFYVAKERAKNGRKNFQIVYQSRKK